jgi:hypothetical protein
MSFLQQICALVRSSLFFSILRVLSFLHPKHHVNEGNHQSCRAFRDVQDVLLLFGFSCTEGTNTDLVPLQSQQRQSAYFGTLICCGSHMHSEVLS